MDEVQAEA